MIVTRSPSSAAKPLCEIWPGIDFASPDMRAIHRAYSSPASGFRRLRKIVTTMLSLPDPRPPEARESAL